MDQRDLFPDYDLIDGFLELYNKTVIKERTKDTTTHANGQELFGVADENEDGKTQDDSDYILKDFNPLTKSNVWLDQSLDKYYEKFKDDANDQYELDKKEYHEYLIRTQHNHPKEREKHNLHLPQEV